MFKKTTRFMGLVLSGAVERKARRSKIQKLSGTRSAESAEVVVGQSQRSINVTKPCRLGHVCLPSGARIARARPEPSVSAVCWGTAIAVFALRCRDGSIVCYLNGLKLDDHEMMNIV